MSWKNWMKYLHPPDLQCCHCRLHYHIHHILPHHCCQMYSRHRCCRYFRHQKSLHCQNSHPLCLHHLLYTHHPQKSLPDLLHQYSHHTDLTDFPAPVQPLPRLPVLQLLLLLQLLLPLPDVLLLPQLQFALPQAARSLPAAER